MRLVFQEPMPFSRGLGKDILYICISGICALLIFYLIRPSGFSGLTDLALLKYGLICIGTAMFYAIITHWLYSRYSAHIKWTVGMEILRSLFFLFFIAAGIMIYSRLAHHSDLNFKNAVLYLFYTLVFGIIPVSIRAILEKNQRLKKDLVETKKLNELLNCRKAATDEKLMEFPVSRSETLKLTNQELLYVESAENYITVTWNKEDIVKKLMIRMTMKDAIKQISDPFIVFCHRSYIVNLRKVHEIVSHSGTSAIILNGVEKQLPLSNTFKGQIRQKLKEM